MINENDLTELSTDALRKRLGDAERKYYGNLHQLQEQLTRQQSVQELSKNLIRTGDPLIALDQMAESSVRNFGVEKAVILHPQESGYCISTLRGYSRRKVRELENQVLFVDEPAVALVRENGKSQLFENCERSLGNILDLNQMIVCPLRSDSGEFYGFYIIGFSPKKIALYRSFSENDLKFFEMVASQVSALLQNIRLRETFKKFVPRQFLDHLAKERLGDITLGKAESAVMTILFADIRSFTAMSETLEPQELLNFMNAYFERMNAAIHENDGFIDKFIGDAIMALFIDENPKLGANNAVQSAMDMLSALKQYNQERDLGGLSPISIGIGIHTGEAVIGTVGSADRMDSTALGDSVNLASRIESLTKQHNAELLISAQTYAHVANNSAFHCHKIGFVNIRGREEEELIYNASEAFAKSSV